MACRILVPQPGIKPIPPAVEAQCVNHWPTRKLPSFIFLKWNSVQCLCPTEDWLPLLSFLSCGWHPFLSSHFQMLPLCTVPLGFFMLFACLPTILLVLHCNGFSVSIFSIILNILDVRTTCYLHLYLCCLAQCLTRSTIYSICGWISRWINERSILYPLYVYDIELPDLGTKKYRMPV